MGYMNDRDLAKDLTQDTFVSVWRNLSSFRNQSKISTWIFRIATNNCLRAIERAKKMDPIDNDFEIPDIPEESIEGKLKYLYSCIAELEEVERIIISLFLEDVPQAEIAEILGLSHGNVRIKIHRIKEKLAIKFKRYGQFE